MGIWNPCKNCLPWDREPHDVCSALFHRISQEVLLFECLRPYVACEQRLHCSRDVAKGSLVVGFCFYSPLICSSGNQEPGDLRQQSPAANPVMTRWGACLCEQADLWWWIQIYRKRLWAQTLEVIKERTRDNWGSTSEPSLQQHSLPCRICPT